MTRLRAKRLTTGTILARFFSFRTDDQMHGYVREYFDVLDFHVVEPEGVHFQSFTLRKPVLTN